MTYRYWATLALVAGCGGRTIVGGGPAFSYGSVAVPEAESGVGGGIEIGHYRARGAASLGLVLAYDIAGYTAAADGDGIQWTELQGRYRRELREPGQAGPYFSFGPTVGFAAHYLNDGVVGLFAELGWEQPLSDTLAIDVSLRERPAFFFNEKLSGDLHNTLMLGIDLVIGSRPTD